MGVDGVVAELTRLAEVPERRVSAPLYFAFDHCFSVRGKGTILTGTVLTGVLKVSFEGGKERLTSQQYIVVFQGPCDLILQVLVLTVPVSNLFQAFATLPPCKRHYETASSMPWSPQVHQLVELPTLRLQKKVKSMQMFRKPVSIAR